METRITQFGDPLAWLDMLPWQIGGEFNGHLPVHRKKGKIHIGPCERYVSADRPTVNSVCIVRNHNNRSDIMSCLKASILTNSAPCLNTRTSARADTYSINPSSAFRLDLSGWLFTSTTAHLQSEDSHCRVRVLFPIGDTRPIPS